MSDELYYMAVGAVIGAAAVFFVRKRRSKNKEDILPQEEPKTKTKTESEIESLEKDISKMEKEIAEEERVVKAHEEQVKLAEAAINKPPFEQYINMYAQYSSPKESILEPEEDEPEVNEDLDEPEGNPDPKDRPYAIVDERIGEYGYERIQLYLLMPSKKLVDSDFELVENVPLWVGSDFIDKLDLEEGGGAIRNDILKCDFMIECLWRSYDDVALMRPNPPTFLDD